MSCTVPPAWARVSSSAAPCARSCIGVYWQVGHACSTPLDHVSSSSPSFVVLPSGPSIDLVRSCILLGSNFQTDGGSCSGLTKQALSPFITRQLLHGVEIYKLAVQVGLVKVKQCWPSPKLTSTRVTNKSTTPLVHGRVSVRISETIVCALDG